MTNKLPKCLCCGKEMTSSQEGEDAWYVPSGGIFLESIGGNYGSTLFDEIMGFDGDCIKVLETVICDDCFNRHPDRWRITKCTPLRELRETTENYDGGPNT